MDSDFKWWTLPVSPALSNEGQDIKNSLTEPHAELRPLKLSNETFSKQIKAKILDFIHPTSPENSLGGRCRTGNSITRLYQYTTQQLHWYLGMAKMSST